MSMIYNEAAWERGRDAAIKRNASKRRNAEFHAQNADAQRIEDFLHATGEFEERCKRCKCGWRRDEHLITEQCGTINHPVFESASYGKGGEIISDLRDALNEWGSLTQKQTDLVRSMIARAEKRVAERAQAREQRLAADRAGSRHIGVVGERIKLDLTVERILAFEGHYGMTYINLCRDASGNVVVYKGSITLGLAEAIAPFQVTVKATVKSHDQRDGVAQTLISRPKEVAA